MNINLDAFVQTLREEAAHHIFVAGTHEGTLDPIWTARVAAAHTLSSLAHAIKIGMIYAEAPNLLSRDPSQTVGGISPFSEGVRLHPDRADSGQPSETVREERPVQPSTEPLA